MNPALNQPPARQRHRENLKGNGVRGKSQNSTGKESLLVLVLAEKFSKQQQFSKFKRNIHGLQQKRKISVTCKLFFSLAEGKTMPYMLWVIVVTLASPNKGAYSTSTNRTKKLHVILCCTI